MQKSLDGNWVGSELYYNVRIEIFPSIGVIMSFAPQELEAAALALSRSERAELARRLIESLDDEDELSAAWRDEARERVAGYRDGSIESVSSEDVMREARSRINS